MHDITKELGRITKKYSSLITNDELTHYYTNADLKTKQIILKEIEYSFIPNIKLKNKNLKNMTKEGFNHSLLIIQHEGNKTKIKYLLDWVKKNKELSKEVKELEPTNKIRQKSNTNLLNGKKLNIAERYKLLQDIFKCDEVFNSLNTMNKDKSRLLALILDTNIDNARKVLNGTYDGKINKIEIENYIKELKR